MKRFLVLCLVALFPICALAAEPAQNSVMLNGLRYEASVASMAVAPKTLIEIPIGTGKNEVGSDEQDKEHRTEGAPYAFFALKDNSVWVLDTINQKIKHFAPNGDAMAEISLPEHPDKFSRARDLAPGPQDSFYVLCASDGKVERINAKGQIITEIEGLNDVWEIGADPKGNVLVKNPSMNGLMRFNPESEMIEMYDGQADYSVYTDLEGNPYGIRADEQTAVFFKLVSASPTMAIDLATFTLKLPAGDKVHYFNTRICGVDAAANIYIELIAGDNDGVMHQNQIVKVSPNGGTLGKIEMLNIPFMAPDLPRHRVVMPDGRILGFAIDKGKYILHTYSIP